DTKPGKGGSGGCDVCHNPHNYHTINIPRDQVDKFLSNHPGDFRGSCQVTPVTNPYSFSTSGKAVAIRVASAFLFHPDFTRSGTCRQVPVIRTPYAIRLTELVSVFLLIAALVM